MQGAGQGGEGGQGGGGQGGWGGRVGGVGWVGGRVGGVRNWPLVRGVSPPTHPARRQGKPSGSGRA